MIIYIIIRALLKGAPIEQNMKHGIIVTIGVDQNTLNVLKPLICEKCIFF